MPPVPHLIAAFGAAIKCYINNTQRNRNVARNLAGLYNGSV
jgi:hypothetical protein